jgi:hypothetical protein
MMQLNFLHRFAGTMMVLAANLHGIGYSEYLCTFDIHGCSYSRP